MEIFSFSFAIKRQCSGDRWVSRIRHRLVIGGEHFEYPSSTPLVSIVAPTPGHYHYTYTVHTLLHTTLTDPQTYLRIALEKALEVALDKYEENNKIQIRIW